MTSRKRLTFAGAISQWGEVKKKHPKPKESHVAAADTTSSRGRGRGGFEGRGRGRGTDRGRGASRGAREASQTNGTSRGTDKTAKPTDDGWGDSSGAAPVTTSDGWDGNSTAPATTGGWDSTEGQVQPVASTDRAADEPVKDTVQEPAKNATAAAFAAPQQTKSSAAPAGKVSGWAGLFAKPLPPAVPKQAAVPAPPVEYAQDPTAPQIIDESATNDAPFTESLETPAVPELDHDAPESPATDLPITLTPSKDELTETNLEQLPDSSHPHATATAASTAASTQDPASLFAVPTPAIRPGAGISGYAASALKATSGAGRSASFTRKIMEQKEAVVMPGEHAVDRAAVQFGSMGLGASEDAAANEEREEPETRTQMIDDSPVAPRASLPPAPQGQTQTQAAPEVVSAPRPAPGLPPAPQQSASQASPAQTTAYADQFARYGQSGQKAYDPFGQQQHVQQHTQHAPQDSFGAQNTQSQPASTSQAQDYSAYYAQHQDAYRNYYGGYGQSPEHQQRSGSAFGSSGQDNPALYAGGRPQAAYAQDSQGSGDNTPNPTAQSQHQQQHQHQHQQQQMHQNQAYGGHQYGYPSGYNQQYPQYGNSYMNQMSGGGRYGQSRPMFDDVRRQGGSDDYYMQQNSHYGYGQQHYGGGSYNKSSMYGQPQHQYSYDHSAGPANTSGPGQTSVGGRDATYGRTSSAQPSETQASLGNGSFGGMQDPFGRTSSGFGHGQSQQHGSQLGSEDAAKGYDGNKNNGPSPALGQAQHRPGSATQALAGQQQGSSGYPSSHSTSTNQYPQYGQFGGMGGHQGQNPQSQQQQQQSGYGSYGGGNHVFGNYGAGPYGGRGWSGSYGSGH